MCSPCVLVHSWDKADNLLMDGGCEFAFVFCISDLLNGGKRSRLNLETVLHNCTIFGVVGIWILLTDILKIILMSIAFWSKSAKDVASWPRLPKKLTSLINWVFVENNPEFQQS